MRTRALVYAIGGLTILVAPLAAQRDVRGRGRDVPPGQVPPAGMCRIWIPGVPPGRQPAPTDCETAQRNRPRDGRIVYGADRRGGDRDRDFDRRRALENRRDRNRDWDRDRDRDRRDRDRARDDRDWRDRDRDGRRAIDRQGRGDDYDRCVDTNRDGRCDTTANRRGYPGHMPMMRSAHLYRMGVRAPDVEDWLGGGRFTAQVDEQGDRASRVRWLDGNRLVQVWHDDDRDGRVDRVDIVENGRVVRTIR